MAEELQQLFNRINSECLEKAEQEKNEILSAARAEAARIIAEAKKEAAEREKAAEAAAAGFQKRAEAAARQAARDVILALRGELEARLARAIDENAAKALTPEFMAGLVNDLAAAFVKNPGGEITVLAAARDAGKLKDALKATLNESFRQNAAVFTATGVKSGLQISFNGSDVYYDFSDAAIRDLLSGYLGGELARLFEADEQ